MKGKDHPTLWRRFISLPPIVHIFLIVYVLLMSNAIGDPADLQWDFRKDYNAAKAYSEGQDPYLLRPIYVGENALGPGPVALPYTYPPATLLFFRIFVYFGDDLASYTHLTLTALALSAVLSLWAYAFPEKELAGYFTLLCLLGYNQTLASGLLSGNISALEQLLIWAGFLQLIKGRLRLFCASILAAAAFKLTPAVFLLLLLESKDKDAKKYFIASSAVFAAYLAASYISSPALFSGYANNLSMALDYSDRGSANPSALSFMQTAAAVLGGIGVKMPAELAGLGYLSFALAVAAVSAMAYHLLSKKNDAARLILLACLTYALVLPRLKDYSLAILIAPTYYTFTRPRYRRHILPLTAAAILPAPYFALTGAPADLIQFYPLATAFLVWAMFVHDIASDAGVNGKTMPHRPSGHS